MTYHIMNYTSTVSAEKSILDIERLLWSAGATKIAKDANADGQVTAFIFALPVGEQTLPFRLPCDTERVFAVLWAEIKKPHNGTKKRLRQQADRVAWRILLDWMKAQVTMVKLNQAKAEEVFLPYMWNGKQTFFQQMEQSHFMLPSGIETAKAAQESRRE